MQITNSNAHGASAATWQMLIGKLNEKAKASGIELPQLDLGAIEGVELTISKDAQRLFNQMQEQFSEQSFTWSPQEFEEFTHPDLDVRSAWTAMTQNFSEQGQRFMSAVMVGFLNEEMFTPENIEGNAAMAEIGYNLTQGILFYQHDKEGFLANLTDLERVTMLANRYAEMRQSFEEQYSGEELENKLNHLSQAFNLTVEKIAHISERFAYMSMRMDSFRISLHNKLLERGQPGMFNGGMIEFDEEQFSNMQERVSTGMRESVSHFAHLIRQFVLENGAVNSEQQQKLLESFLRAAPPSSGGFTFDEFNALSEILGHGRSQEAPEPGSPLVRRTQDTSLLTELLRFFR
jgi:hypothetical protein